MWKDAKLMIVVIVRLFLGYLYIEKTIAQLDSLDSLQKYCREKYINFHLLRHI